MDVIITKDPIICNEDLICEEKQDTRKTLLQRSCKEEDVDCEEICKDDGKDETFLEKDKKPKGYGFCKVNTYRIKIQIA